MTHLVQSSAVLLLGSVVLLLVLLQPGKIKPAQFIEHGV